MEFLNTMASIIIIGYAIGHGIVAIFGISTYIYTEIEFRRKQNLPPMVVTTLLNEGECIAEIEHPENMTWQEYVKQDMYKKGEGGILWSNDIMNMLKKDSNE